MSSQTSLTTRRQFLNRSAWGFGSAFILPSLLASCIDHPIDPTNPPIKPPLLGSEAGDWNNSAKTVVSTGLQLVPDVGGFASALLDIIWPSSTTSPWDAVRAQVESLIDQKIADNDFQTVKANLAGIKNVVGDFETQVYYNSDVKTFWFQAYTDLDLYLPNFQVAGQEVLLLPLFAQFANVYLEHLRTGLRNAQNENTWGFTDGERFAYSQIIRDRIQQFSSYVTTWYQNGRAAFAQKTPDEVNVEPFRSTNNYDRQMTMLVLDYMDAWPYYNPTFFPFGAQDNYTSKPIPLFTREIYSDPYGSLVLDGAQQLINLPSQATQFPNQVTVWASSTLPNAVQLSYPAGGGPNGVTTTPRMGGSEGGPATSFDPSGNPITQFQVTTNPPPYSTDNSLYVTSLQFKWQNGGESSPFGNTNSVSKFSGWIGYDNYALSSIYVQGTNPYAKNTSMNCIVFGFKRWPLV